MAPLPNPIDVTSLVAHPGDAASQNRDAALAALNKEINQHLTQQGQASYLDKAVSWVTSPFHHEDATLQSAQQIYQKAIKDKSVSAADIKTATADDARATGLNQNIDQIGSELLKTGALFMRGRVGLAASLVTYGLSQTKANDSFGNQATDFALGGLKGSLMQGLFTKIGNTQMNFAAKGVIMGTTSRSLDLGLTRSTWTDPKTGEASLAHGLTTMQQGALNKSALISDVAVFGVASGLSVAANRLTAGALERNKVLATSFTGATFGLTGGAYNEYQRQQKQNEKFDLTKIIGAAVLHGTVDGIAAIPGGIQGAAAMRVGHNDATSNQGQTRTQSDLQTRFQPGDRSAGSGINTAESLALPSLSGVKSAFAPELPASRQFALEPLKPVSEHPDVTAAKAAVSESGQNAVGGAEKPASSTAQSDVTIFSALKQTPPEGRLAVWQQQVKADRSGNLAASSNAIDLLPAGDKLAAVEHVLKTAPESARFLVKSVDPSQLPELTSSIISNTSGPERTNLLNRIYVGDATPAVAESTIKAASSLTGPDLDVVRSWFRDLPEPPTEWTASRAATPVRDGIAANLDPQYLGKLLFEGRENGVDVAKLSQEDPQLVRKLAKVTDIADGDHMENVAKVVAKWQSSGSLEASTRSAIDLASGAKNGVGVEALPDVLTELAAKSSPAEVSRMLEQLRQSAISGSGTKGGGDQTQVWLAATTAARVGKINGNASMAESTFFKPVVDALSDQNLDYNWRSGTARTLSNLERTGDLPEGAINVPELRMPAITNLSDGQKTELRSQSEAALRGDKPLSSLIGDGPLGKLFPQVFGAHEQGGIVDRPQHEGHDYPVDQHTENVLKNVRENPLFAGLSEKDQTNLLWASLLHDVAKRPGIVDPGHEANSANVGWGVLKTLGYSPARIARITNLISSHLDVGFQPENPTAAKLSNPDYIDQAAVKYNHPAAVTQLRILNEADIRSVKANGALWSEDIGGQLNDLSKAVAARSHELSSGKVPVLTSDLPQRSGLFNAPDNYAVLGHVTSHLEGNFFGKLPVLESPQYSLSGSLLTPENANLFDPNARMVPLFQGAPDAVSQAYHGSTGSGETTGWQGHVDLFKDWPSRSESYEMSSALEKPLSQLGFGNDKVSALDDFRKQLADYDSIDELIARTGANSPLSKGYREVVRSLTTDGEGNPISEENEIKLNNATLVGLGVYRHGQQVALDGASATDLAAVLRGSEAPDWLAQSVKPGDNVMTIPKSVWSQLHLRDLPIVVLDP
jgi:hypothetical protein